MTVEEIQKSIGDSARLVRGMNFKPQEEGQDLVFGLLGDRAEIYRDADRGCFIKCHNINTQIRGKLTW